MTGSVKRSITSKLATDLLVQLSVPMLESSRMEVIYPLSVRTKGRPKSEGLEYEETVSKDRQRAYHDVLPPSMCALMYSS